MQHVANRNPGAHDTHVCLVEQLMSKNWHNPHEAKVWGPLILFVCKAEMSEVANW